MPDWNLKFEYTYEGENVLSVNLTDYSTFAKEVYKMSKHKSALYEIYRQMGFNPMRPYEVVSKNNIALGYSKKVRDFDEVVTPDWTKATKYESTYNEYDMPTLIKIPKSEMNPGTNDRTIRVVYE